MGLRQSINNNPIVTTALTAAIMIAAIWYILHRTLGNRPTPPRIPTQCYFSDDDGKTWFIDDAKNVPPFDHNGKKAYKAILFRCKDGKPFVARLEGFDDEAKGMIQDEVSKGRNVLSAEYQTMTHGMMIKHPGDADWTTLKPGDSASARQWGEIMSIHCPDGGLNAKPVSVEENAKPE